MTLRFTTTRPPCRTSIVSPHREASRSAGFSLIEVLVALVILGVGLLGLAGLQASSLRAGTDAYLRTQANVLAYNIIDRMRANHEAVSNGDYDLATGASVTASTDCGTTSCSPTALADWDRKQWLAALAKRLPDASSSISTAAAGDHTKVTVVVTWHEQRIQKGAAASDTTLTVTTLL